MKLPLRWGLSLLAVLLLLASLTSYGEGKVPLMIVAMGVALWTAFSLPMPEPPPAPDEEEEFEDATGVETEPLENEQDQKPVA